MHVSPKTEVYLDFSIKNAGFVFAVETVETLCDFSVFAYNLYSFNKYIGVKFGTEELKQCLQKIAKLKK